MDFTDSNMSRRQDRLNYTATPFELDYGDRVQTGLILGAYEQEMKDIAIPKYSPGIV